MGARLRELYCCHLEGQGITKTDISRDLRKVNDDMRETRKLRIETILDREKKLFERK